MEDHEQAVDGDVAKAGERPVPQLAKSTRRMEQMMARVLPDSGVSRLDVSAFNSSILKVQVRGYSRDLGPRHNPGRAMASITELAEQINVGLKQDEATAAAAAGENSPNWRTGTQTEGYGYDADQLFLEDDGIGWGMGEGEATPAHAARHDPARVLADVAPKRQLLDQVLGWEHEAVPTREETLYCVSVETPGTSCDYGRDALVLAVLQLLAQPYRETT